MRARKETLRVCGCLARAGVAAAREKKFTHGKLPWKQVANGSVLAALHCFNFADLEAVPNREGWASLSDFYGFGQVFRFDDVKSADCLFAIGIRAIYNNLASLASERFAQVVTELFTGDKTTICFEFLCPSLVFFQ